MAQADLTEGPVWRALAKVSAPMTLGILAVLSVGIADAFFLGMLSGEALAAVGFIYPVTMALTSLSIGLSAGANAALSQAIGRRDDENAVHRIAVHAIGLAATLALIAALAFWAFNSTIFALMGAGSSVQDEIAAYTPIWSMSFPILVTAMVTGALFRARGDAAWASVFMILSAVTNIALTPLLVFGWGPIEGLGTAGAAWATLAGRLVELSVAMIVAIRFGYLRPLERVWRGFSDSFRQVVSVGAPAAFSNAINPAGMALVTAAVATLGDAAVAGFGAATRVQSVAIVAMLALSAGIGPVVGQNWGAEKQDRAQTAVTQAWSFCVAYGLAAALVLTLFADTFAGWVAGGGEATDYAAQYLRIVGWSLFGYGILVTANAAMNGRSKAVYSMTLSVARIFAIYLPLAWAGVMLFGYAGILGAAVIANLAAVAGALYFARRAELLPPPARMGQVLTA